MKIPISAVKAIREQLGMTHLIVIARDADGVTHVSTHGHTQADAREAASLGNTLKKSLGFPEDACRSVPLSRTCGNCVFYKPDYGLWCFNGWSRDGSSGHCLVEPSVMRVGKEYGCRHFEPK